MAEEVASRKSTTPGGGWVPVPDPTALTTEAVEKATEQYRRELGQLRELIEVRLNGMDTAMAEHLKDMGQLRKQLEEKIKHLGDLTYERFTGIDRRFEDRDARLATHDRTGEKALATALEASREISDQHDRYNGEAINKAQIAINEKISALEQVGSTSRGALEQKIDDARTRITTIESLTRGITENRTEQRLNTGQAVAVFVAVIIAIGAIVSVLSYAHK